MTPEDQARDVEQRVGHPGEKWEALKERIQADGVRRFADVEAEWLDLMWTLDAYRIARVPPRGMGNRQTETIERLNAVYRGKGNWFAAALALLLHNRTAQRIAPRQRVQGFSQLHQIDLAWPAREVDVRVCAETKVTGAPGHGRTRARGSRDDYSNRRKEIKFAATDLKLFRRQQDTVIEHWDVWRLQETPKFYFLWAARLEPSRERLARLVREAQGLVNTYLDGAGIFAWQERQDGRGYEALPIPASARVTDLDDVLHRIATVIRQEAPTGEPPPPEEPAERAVPPGQLSEDDG